MITHTPLFCELFHFLLAKREKYVDWKEEKEKKKINTPQFRDIRSMRGSSSAHGKITNNTGY